MIDEFNKFFIAPSRAITVAQSESNSSSDRLNYMLGNASF